MTHLYPLLRHTWASPIPVLPAVPSTTVPPGLMRPFSSASLTRYSAARSLIDPPGDMNSALARMLQPVSSERRFSRIYGEHDCS